MTTTDKWLLERARKKKQGLEPGRFDAAFDAEIDELWSSLQTETRREVAVYNGAAGDKNALVVTTDADVIDARAADGRQLTVKLHRDRRSVSETFRTRAGAVRSGRPRIGFIVSTTGRLTFNFGVVQSVAASILRRVT